jgi:cyclophilin family peptidyl-prolyl cis-trans isomerase
MSVIKDAIGDNKKFLLLAFTLMLVVVMVFLVIGSGIYNPSTGQIETGSTSYSEPKDVIEEGVDYKLLVSTIYGDIKIDLYEDKAPQNINSLLFLIGERYYEGLTFHKVVKNFVVQAGDDKGDGTGDPGYTVQQENLSTFKQYDVGMANASQFFIVLPNADMSKFNNLFPLVGEVTEGFAVLDSMQKVQVDENYRPLNDILIDSIQIHEN